MNLCFIMGEIVSNVEFDFAVNGKHFSIARFKMKLTNEAIANVVTYDENADFCYQRLDKGDMVFIEGKIDSNINILPTYISII